MYPAPYTSGEAFDYARTTTVLPPGVVTDVTTVPTYITPPAMGYPAYSNYPPLPPTGVAAT